MKTNLIKLIKLSALAGSAAAAVSTAQAQPDWSPAIWRSAYAGHWYTSGYGHRFAVVHDMEGYYASTISFFQRSTTSASVNYCVNGVKDTSTDYPAGEITQMVRDAYYAWHACCWNQYMCGTEHEGFASNPAWYTDIMYQNSSSLYRHYCTTYGIARDRNHIIAHYAKSSAAWVTWMEGQGYSAAFCTCNSHTDPGQYWDWTRFIGYIAGSDNASLVSQSIPDNTPMNAGQGFTCTWTLSNNGGSSWINLGGLNGYTLNYMSGTQMGATPYTGLSGNVIPGGQKAISVGMTAPTANGTYTANFQMNNCDVQAYGPLFHVTIVVGGSDNASAVSDTAPAHVTVGKVFSATVVMNNNGSTTWTSAGNYKLGSQDAQDNTTWGFSRVALPATTAPGANATFTFNATAPTTPGTYSFDWEMLVESVHWFGAKATTTIIVDPLVTAIVDNADAGFSIVGAWSTGTSSTDKYGADYRFRSTGIADSATWTTNLGHTGNYSVYAWWSHGSNRPTAAPYSVNANAAVNENQQVNGGVWNLIGSYALSAGNNAVTVSANSPSGYTVIADAVKFVEY